MNIRALSLHPEWAWAVAHLDKRIENRGYPCPRPLRGQRICIHASKVIGGCASKSRRVEAIRNVFEAAHDAGWSASVSYQDGYRCEFLNHDRPLHGLVLFEERSLPLGKIVALATIDQLLVIDRKERIPWSYASFYHWTLSNVVTLPEPIMASGMQGFWSVKEEMVDAIKEQLGDHCFE